MKFCLFLFVAMMFGVGILNWYPLAKENEAKAVQARIEKDSQILSQFVDETDREAIQARRELPFKIAADPSNYGCHNEGNQEGMCLGFAINLLYRLQNETDVVAELYRVQGFCDVQPTAPHDPAEPAGYGWGHAFVVFWTPWDNKCWAVDQNVARAVEVDLNRVDWTASNINDSFATECLKTLWSHLKTHYPFAFDGFNIGVRAIDHGKREILDYFDDIANVYCKMQDHPYYFPRDWCVD